MPNYYQPVTPAIVSKLRAIVGDENVLYGDPDCLVNYAHDEVPGPEHAHLPDVVVKPVTAQPPVSGGGRYIPHHAIRSATVPL